MSNTENTLVLSTDDKSAAALVATIKAAVNGEGKYAAYVTDHTVTRDNVKVHAAALAVLTYPNEKPVQTVNGKRTKFGNAVQAAGAGLRAALDSESGSTTTKNLLTREGKSATMEQVIAEWKAAQS